MNPIRSTNLMKPVLAGATAATLLAVTVYHGAARVQTPDRRAPVELAQNDRLLVEPELPPLVTRNAAPSENPVVNIPVWREEFDATMNAHLADIRHCYELGLDKAPSLSGKLLLKLRVVRHGNRGAIDDVEILPEGRNVNAPVTDQCVLEAVSRIEPPAPSKGGFEALYPVTFDVKPALDDDMKLLNPRF